MNDTVFKASGADDERFMRMALNEAMIAAESGEVPIGAVVVGPRGTIVGRGHNLTETLADVTAHAEMQAITAAAQTLGGKYLAGCTLYVTVEPCLMCAGAIAWAQVGRIVIGAPDPKRGYTASTRAPRLRAECSLPSVRNSSPIFSARSVDNPGV